MYQPVPGNSLIEELLFDNRTKTTLPAGPWVYTGSTMIGTGFGPVPRRTRRRADRPDARAAGHIDNPRNDAVNGYGSIVLNPKLGVRRWPRSP